MDDQFGAFGVAVVVFVATNVDEAFLLAAFFADPRMSGRAVVLGQFLGTGVLVAASAAAAWAALAVPEGYVALLGLLPLALGIRSLKDAAPNDAELRTVEARAKRRMHSQVLAVAGVTVANGGDNLGVYVPLFAREPDHVPLYGAVFALMTALWCLAGYRLVRSRVVGSRLRRYGHITLPIVLIALGVWILSGARELFR